MCVRREHHAHVFTVLASKDRLTHGLPSHELPQETALRVWSWIE